MDAHSPCRRPALVVATPSHRPVRLLVVVVNYRTPELTLACLESVARELPDFAPGELRVALVENASPDGSEEILRREVAARGYGAWVDLLVQPGNLGFAGGCNAGVAQSPSAELVLFLNSDALVHRGCLRLCVDRMREEPGIGALTCRLLNEDGTIQNSVRRFPTPARLLAAAAGLPWRFPRLFRWADLEDPGWDRARERRDVDWIGGAFLMARGDLLDRVGAFDASFFFYGEDIELCHRIRREGYACRHEPAAATTHLGAGSSDVTRLPDAQRNRLRWEARYLVQRKMYGRGAELLARVTDRVYWRLRGLKARLCRREAAAAHAKEVLSLLEGQAA